MFPVKMIRYFFFFVERVGGGEREREEGREGEARMAQGRERSLFLSGFEFLSWPHLG